MTNQEAIEILKIERDHMVPTLLPERIEAMDMAISALQAQDVPGTNVGDMVSRKAVELALIEKGQSSKRYKLGEFWELNGEEIREALATVPSAHPESTRTFVELVVEYIDPELCTYKEYKGKPYYSIKYIENGEKHVGYGTYNPEVLSQYLKEYFISSTQPEPCEDAVSRQAVIDAARKVHDIFEGEYDTRTPYGVIFDVQDAVCKLPSVQPKIIRCKDCKHWRQQTNYQGTPLSFGFCESDDMWRSLYGETTEVSHIDTDDDFYCGYAERRTDD